MSETTKTESIEKRLEAVADRGVVIVDPRQTWIGHDVDPNRLHEGAFLHPGTRLSGSKLFLGPGAVVGREGPTTLMDAVLDESAHVDSGFASGAVLLRNAAAGSGSHLRTGTLLEEEASTAHCVGLKQTILLSFVTLGSLINFCDCLMAGGRSRKEHSEVGSGFIHFNFTPWGARGDKATPSLIGDVVRGVFLREDKIFLGGSAGLVGPCSIGYGSITGAGQVVRKDVPDNRLVVEQARGVDRPLDTTRLDRAQPRGNKNLAYIGQLVALREWYRQVRLPRVPDSMAFRREVYAAAIELIEGAIAERVKRLEAFLRERDREMPELNLEVDSDCPLAVEPDETDHVAWVQSLPDVDVEAGIEWLQSIADGVLGR